MTRGAQRFPLGRLGLATAAGLARGGPPVGPVLQSWGGDTSNAAAPAPLQGEAPRPTSAPGAGCRPCHSLSLRHRRRLPSTAVGHAPGEDPVHHGPPEALERPAWRRRPPPSPRWRPPFHLLPRPCPHAPLHPGRLPEGESPQSVPRAEGRDSGEARRETRHGLSVDDPRERRRARTPDRGELRGRHQKIASSARRTCRNMARRCFTVGDLVRLVKRSPMDDEDHYMALLSEREDINSSETPSNLTIRQHAWRMGRANAFSKDHIYLASIGPVLRLLSFCGTPSRFASTLGAPTADQRQRLTQAVGAAHPRHGSRCNRPHLDHGQTLELSRATAVCLAIDTKSPTR